MQQCESTEKELSIVLIKCLKTRVGLHGQKDGVGVAGVGGVGENGGIGIGHPQGCVILLQKTGTLGT